MHRNREILREGGAKDRDTVSDRRGGKGEERSEKEGGEKRERGGEAITPRGKNRDTGKEKQPHPCNQLVLGPGEP